MHFLANINSIEQLLSKIQRVERKCELGFDYSFKYSFVHNYLLHVTCSKQGNFAGFVFFPFRSN